MIMYVCLVKKRYLDGCFVIFVSTHVETWAALFFLDTGSVVLYMPYSVCDVWAGDNQAVRTKGDDEWKDGC